VHQVGNSYIVISACNRDTRTVRLLWRRELFL